MSKIQIPALLLSILMTFITGSVFPQWVQTTGPGGALITSLAANNGYLYAGTYYGGLYRSSDNGSNWIQTNYGLPLGSGISTLIINGNNIFAGIVDSRNSVGNGIYLSTDNGSTWSEADSGLTSKYVRAFAVNGNNIFAGTDPLGGIGGVYLSTDNGANWSPIDNGLPVNSTVYTLACCGDNIFAGTNGGGPNGPGGIYLSTNNGVSWKIANTGLQYKPLKSVSSNRNNLSYGNFTSLRKIYSKSLVKNNLLMPMHPSVFALSVSGNKIYAGTTEGVYISSNKGVNWNLITDGLIYGEYVYSFAVNGNNIFAGTTGGVYQSTNNGSLWTEVIDGLPSGIPINALLFSGNNLFAGTCAGVYASANDGINWYDANKGLAASLIEAIAVRGNNIFAGTNNGLYLSTDNGSNWSLSNNGISGYLNTLAISGNNIFAGTDNGVYISTDNGLDWFQAGMNGTSVYSLLAGVDTIFAGTQYGVYLSTDNGTTWSLLSNGIPGNIPFWASAINGNNIFVGGADPNYLYEEVFCSTDKGFSWTKVNVGIPQNNIVTSLAFSGENILAGTDGAGVYLSSDKGSTWSIVNDGLTSPYVHAIAVIGNNIFAGTDTYGGVGGVYVSTNGGSNWTQINDGFTNLEVASLAVSNSNVYAGTGGSGVWKRSVLDLLPLELKVFNATVRQDAVQLVWNTSTEINNYGFEIQRTLHSQSPTDLNWEILGFIKGSGNSNSVKQYSFLDKSILKNGSYYYRLKQVDFDGQYKYYNSAVVDVSFINQSYSLENNYPNPFNPVTVIKYSLSFDSKVKLTIYNALGQTVRELISEIQQSGIHEIKFDGLNLPSGVFYYSILAASLDGKQVYTNSKKMILLK